MMRNPSVLAIAFLSLSCGRDAPADAPVPIPQLPVTDVPVPASKPAHVGDVPSAASTSAADDGSSAVIWKAHQVMNAGVLCLSKSREEHQSAQWLKNLPTQKPLEIRPDEATYAVVETPYSLSGACIRILDQRCKATRTGREIRIESHGSYELPEGPAPCTEGGIPTAAVCRLPPLKAGEYTLHWGEKSLRLKVPSRLAQPCMD